MEPAEVIEVESTNSYLYLGLFVLLVIVIIVIILVVVFVGVKTPINTMPTTQFEEILNDDVEQSNVVDVEDNRLLELGDTSTAKFSLFCVPAIQPPLTHEAKKYGGFHMTLFPSQNMPVNYSIVRAMQGFAINTNQQWNLMLPGITTKVKQVTSKNLVLMMVYGAQTINTLRTYLQTSAGGSWTKPWGSNHVTLGSIDPPDQAKPEDFTHQTTWYVQLVRNPGHHWLPNERVLLYIAQGRHN